jgi:hypothetical protein
LAGELLIQEQLSGNPVLVLAGTHAGVYLDTKGVINTPSGSMVRVIGASWGGVDSVVVFLGDLVRTRVFVTHFETCVLR